MTVTEDKIEYIKFKIAKTYPCFGKGSHHTPYTEGPISRAMAGDPLKFALGVDVDSVVRFIINEIDSPKHTANNVPGWWELKT